MIALDRVPRLNSQRPVELLGSRPASERWRCGGPLTPLSTTVRCTFEEPSMDYGQKIAGKVVALRELAAYQGPQ